MSSKQLEFRRYLVPIDSLSTQQFFTDCLVIGSGVAGLRAAIEAASLGAAVTVVCKGTLTDSNTWHAQGGIASVIRNDDSFESHIADTLAAGAGLCEPEVVRQVVKEGPALVRQLMEWGTPFDQDNGTLDVSLEGGHSHPRIIHSHGDSTGRGIAEGLIQKLKTLPQIRVIEQFFAIDLLTNSDNECLGVLGSCQGTLQIVWAAKTILATGGAGRLYRETTNPEGATGDGLAMAYRVGAVLRDMEFLQFHPTTLYIAGASRALITETIRGEGAILRDRDGKAFMKEYHPDGELAPRDVVSRAILDRMLKTGSTHVYLDLRHFDKEYFRRRFPTISELCESFAIDISRDMIPVRPSAHYMIGGVKADRNAATNIPRLYACGEVASTGLHGANRLGSNSLLEGLVYGRIAGQKAAEGLKSPRTHLRPRRIEFQIAQSKRSYLDTEDVRNSLRSLMWRNVGITRQAKHLDEAQEIIRFWQRYVMDKVFERPFGWETQNMLTVSLLMAQAAAMRTESRGVHFRSDFPERDDAAFARHIEQIRENA